MKRAGFLMDEILAWDNLTLAFYRASKGKSDRTAVIRFRENFETNLCSIQKALSQNTMVFGRYVFFTIRDPKTRRICAADFRERVAHHAMMNVCGPVLEKSQIHHSFACRKNKGQHKALKLVENWSGCHPFYLKMDIVKFFDSIDHPCLKKKLAGKIKDRQVLDIFDKIIDSYHTGPGRGLPLGNLTSQCFANFYLAGFDQWMKNVIRSRFYLRYMDDMIVLGGRDELVRIREQCRDYLGTKLQLKIKTGGQINRTDRGIGFLGSVVYPGVIRLSTRAKKRVRSKIKRYEKDFIKGRISDLKLQQCVSGVWNGIEHSGSMGWRKNAAAKCIDA